MPLRAAIITCDSLQNEELDLSRCHLLAAIFPLWPLLAQQYIKDTDAPVMVLVEELGGNLIYCTSTQLMCIMFIKNLRLLTISAMNNEVE